MLENLPRRFDRDNSTGKLTSISSLIDTRERAFVCCLTAIYLCLAYFWQNISLYDESFYLDSGNHIHASTFIHGLQSSPLYGLWFRILTRFFPDALDRYFASWVLLVTSVSIFPAMLKIPRSWLYTLVLVSIPFFSITPYISLFASLFLVGGLCFILRNESTTISALSISCALCFLIAFARPEYALGVFFSAGAAVIALALGKAHISRRVMVLTLLLVAFLASTMLFVVLHSDTRRSGSAFAQHVNLRASQKGLLGNADPWLSSYAQKALNVDPNDSVVNIDATIGDFFRADPRLFIKYITYNLIDPRMIGLLFAVFLVVIWPWLKPERASLRPVSCFVFLISLPSIASSLLIYPEHHYAVIIFPSVLILALQMLKKPRWITEAAFSWIFVLGFTIMFVHEVAARVEWKLRPPQPTPGVLAVECLRNIEREHPVKDATMFDPIGLPDVYLSSPHKRVAIYDIPDWNSFRSWAIQTKPGWILITPEVATEYHVSSDQVQEFLGLELSYSPHACPASTALTVYSLK